MITQILVAIVVVIIVISIIWAVVSFKAMKTERDIMKNISKDWEDPSDKHK